MNNEIKISLPQGMLDKIIEECYYADGQKGKLKSGSSYIIDPEKDDVLYTVVKDMTPMIIRGFNKNVMEGTVKLLSETVGEHIELKPLSNYCVPNEMSGLYSFY